MSDTEPPFENCGLCGDGLEGPVEIDTGVCSPCAAVGGDGYNALVVAPSSNKLHAAKVDRENGTIEEIQCGQTLPLRSKWSAVSRHELEEYADHFDCCAKCNQRKVAGVFAGITTVTLEVPEAYPIEDHRTVTDGGATTEEGATHLYEPVGPALGAYRILDSVADDLTDDELADLTERISYALQHFPELNGATVTVGKKQESDTWYAEADWTNDIILLPTHEECPYLTICHELAHLAIKKLDECGVDVPTTSEEFCSIFAVARVPAGRIDEPRIAYLGHPTVDRREWPGICRRALDYREDHHDYIKQCQRWLGIEDGDSA